MTTIRPVRTEADYRSALVRIDDLWNATPGTDAGDELDVMITLVQSYEREHFPVLPPDPIEAIKFRVEQMGIGRKGLEPVLGSRARVAEVLGRKRALSIVMIRRLHEDLGISADVLIRDSRGGAKSRTNKGRGSAAHSAWVNAALTEEALRR